MARPSTQEALSSDLSWLQPVLWCIIIFLESTKRNPKDLTTCLGLWSNMVADKIKILMLCNSILDSIFEWNSAIYRDTYWGNQLCAGMFHSRAEDCGVQGGVQHLYGHLHPDWPPKNWKSCLDPNLSGTPEPGKSLYGLKAEVDVMDASVPSWMNSSSK